jgi:hypothetical protein
MLELFAPKKNLKLSKIAGSARSIFAGGILAACGGEMRSD